MTERRAGGEDARALERRELRLRLALEAGGLGVWEWDRAAGTVVWDRTLEAIFGLEPGGAPTTFEGYVATVHPEDRDVVIAVIERAVTRGEPYRVEHRAIGPDGRTVWIQGDGRPLSDGGRITGLIGVCSDVTERHEAEVELARLLAQEADARRQLEAARSRLEFLADATTAMGEALDLDARLQRLAELGVPRFADLSAVYLLDQEGEPKLIALHADDADRVATLRELVDRWPARLDTPISVLAAVRDGRTVWLPEVTEASMRGASLSEEHLEEIRAFRPAAGVAVPLIGPEGAFGAVGFITLDDRRVTADDVALAEELCARISVTIYNGQLLEARERDRALHRYQAALLQSVFEASVDGMLAIGLDGEVLAHNQRFFDLWELDPALAERGHDALLAAAADRVADPEGFLAAVQRVGVGPERVLRDELVLADGRVLDRHGTPVVDDDGRSLGFTWSFRDVTGERARQAAVVEAGERSAMLARTLQRSLLPPTLPDPDGIELAARYHPAYSGAEVGGDFYDVFAVGDEWVLVIGDVCGKGAEAASLTALARYTLRSAAIRHRDPGAMLVELNRAMVDQALPDVPRRFATVCCLRLRTTPTGGSARIACGGHPIPLLVRADGSIEPAGVPGILLGVFDDVDIVSTSVELRPGDVLVAVTDGVLEARDGEGRLLDVEGLRDLLALRVGEPAADLATAIEARALAIQSGAARDDIAVLVARIE